MATKIMNNLGTDLTTILEDLHEGDFKSYERT